MGKAARLDDGTRCWRHGARSIVSASEDVTVNGRGAARVGDLWSCGAEQVEGSPDVFVDSRAWARVGDEGSHGGEIVTGSDDVGVG